MNVNLIYHKTGYSFEISKHSSLSYIFEVASKVFKIPIKDIKMYFKNMTIPNDGSNALEYFKVFPIIIHIFDKTKNRKKLLENLEKIKTNIKLIKKQKQNEKEKEKDKEKEDQNKKRFFIDCQICKRKSSIIYCRECNLFICFECNILYPEHYKHEKINIDSKDYFSCFKIYKNLILEQLNEINNGYKYSLGYIFSEKKRKKKFEKIYDLLEELDKKSETLSIMKPQFTYEDETVKEYNKNLMEIQPPNNKEDVINAFNEVSQKEIFVKNYASVVNLQIIKSKFNKELLKFFEQFTILLNNMIKEIDDRLRDSLTFNEYDIEYIKKYNIIKRKDFDNNSISNSSNLSLIEEEEKTNDIINKSLNTSHLNNKEDEKESNKYNDIKNNITNLKNHLKLNPKEYNNKPKMLSEEKRYNNRSITQINNNINNSISVIRSERKNHRTIALPLLDVEKTKKLINFNIKIPQIKNSFNKKSIDINNNNYSYTNRISNIFNNDDSFKKLDLYRLKLNKKLKLLRNTDEISLDEEKNNINPYIAEISQINKNNKKWW